MERILQMQAETTQTATHENRAEKEQRGRISRNGMHCCLEVWGPELGKTYKRSKSKV